MRYLLLLMGLVFFTLPSNAVTIDWVTVGAPGNAADAKPVNARCGPLANSPCGAVADTYRIGKYDVTNTQYAEFLNKVAASDPNALYSTYMASDPTLGGITRSGSPGSYRYAVKSGFERKPVSFINFWDATRFANWMENGQPAGAQSARTTEDGAYTLTPEAIAANSVLRNPAASIFLPSENQWYKAAYYDPTAELYWGYPMGKNAMPACVTPENDTGNSANCGNVFVPREFTDVGAYTLSAGPNGTFDQGGNLWQWNEEIKVGGTERGARGGDFRSHAIYMAAFADNHGTLEGDLPGYDSLGFRVASIPEPAACRDGLDNDGDGFLDSGEDLGCDSPSDVSERAEPGSRFQCDDGIDNDGDGLIDYPADPGCPFSYATIEDPECDDGIDNDANGAIDFADPKCSAAWPYWEKPPACGLGAELAFVVPLLTWLHSRRRRPR